MSQFIITIPDTETIPSFLDSLAEFDEYSEFIDNHRQVLIGFLDMVFDQLAFSGQEILPSEERQQCPETGIVDIELVQAYDDDVFDLIDFYRTRYGNIVADAYNFTNKDFCTECQMYHDNIQD